VIVNKKLAATNNIHERKELVAAENKVSLLYKKDIKNPTQNPVHIAQCISSSAISPSFENSNRKGSRIEDCVISIVIPIHVR